MTSRPTTARPAAPAAASGRAARSAPVHYQGWTGFADWHAGSYDGTRVLPGEHPGLVIDQAVGTTAYTDPHTGTTARWEYATWTSPIHTPPVPASEVVASWNAHTPAGTWLQAELCGTYTDATATPWYVLGRWTAGDAQGDISRTSVEGQSDGRSSVATDTLAIDDRASGLRLASYALRLTLHRRPGTALTPTVRRVGAMSSDLPDRFTVPASVPGEGAGHELAVPRYSQETHRGHYPQYDNGGEAWCSPTSSQMVIDYWGHRPAPADLAWVDPAFADPQIEHAARHTFDHQYRGCGNWPFNAAYAATYPGMQGVVTRLSSLNALERLIRAGIPVITSQSFLASELDGAGYGTAGHLMCVVGFTAAGDVIANDPASAHNDAVRRVYRRRQFENIWLRTKRYDAEGRVAAGSGGVCYIYWPTRSAPSQNRALRDVGIS
ncbi:peptidase C39 family protein [Kitasatospora sp. NPDC050543]|uniref:peptidase C39 family protein n=1 Tax=Kitasatospora sp. NPDC050543 TaxID=3364054 RepID=UPI003788D62F